MESPLLTVGRASGARRVVPTERMSSETLATSGRHRQNGPPELDDNRLGRGDAYGSLQMAGGHVDCACPRLCGLCRNCSTGRRRQCDRGAEMQTGRLSDG
jgi:hypothetical protein